jgi:hypothetical protein
MNSSLPRIGDHELNNNNNAQEINYESTYAVAEASVLYLMKCKNYIYRF